MPVVNHLYRTGKSIVNRRRIFRIYVNITLIFQQNLFRQIFTGRIQTVIAGIKRLPVFHSEVNHTVIDNIAAGKRRHTVCIARLHINQPVIFERRILPVIHPGLRTFAFRRQHPVRHAAGSRLVNHPNSPAGCRRCPVINIRRSPVGKFSAMHGKHPRRNIAAGRHCRRSQINPDISFIGCFRRRIGSHADKPALPEFQSRICQIKRSLIGKFYIAVIIKFHFLRQRRIIVAVQEVVIYITAHTDKADRNIRSAVITGGKIYRPVILCRNRIIAQICPGI